jgi:hypothetical protein
MAKNKLNSKKQLVAFQQELNDLLNKYDMLPEDGKLHLITSKMNLSATNFLRCKPECLMKKIVELPDGSIKIITWCDPLCQNS